MRYLTTTFSPAMLGAGCSAEVSPLANVGEVPVDLVSAVGHEVTAKILAVLLGREVLFSRANLALKGGDEVWCVIPTLRAAEAREFSLAEVQGAGFRAWYVRVR